MLPVSLKVVLTILRPGPWSNMIFSPCVAAIEKNHVYWFCCRILYKGGAAGVAVAGGLRRSGGIYIHTALPTCVV